MSATRCGAVAALCLVCLGSAACVSARAAGAGGPPSEVRHRLFQAPIESDVAREVHARVNAERARRGLALLRWDDAGAAVAAAHSRDMARRDYFAHVDSDGRTASDRLADLVAGCRGWGTAENIWMARDSTGRHRGVPEAAVSGWMASRGHRNNILGPRYDTAGVGVAVADERVYLTQNFWWCGGP